MSHDENMRRFSLALEPELIKLQKDPSMGPKINDLISAVEYMDVVDAVNTVAVFHTVMVMVCTRLLCEKLALAEAALHPFNAELLMEEGWMNEVNEILTEGDHGN
jgi:hypothetical protein